MSSKAKPDSQATIVEETMLWRALVGFPLLPISYVATQTIGATLEKMMPLLEKASATSLFEVGDGSVIKIPTQIYHNGIDGLIKSLIAFFLPFTAGTDPLARLQTMAFLFDLAPILTIAVIESSRTGNRYTFASV
jgi:hypothetical protein